MWSNFPQAQTNLMSMQGKSLTSDKRDDFEAMQPLPTLFWQSSKTVTLPRSLMSSFHASAASSASLLYKHLQIGIQQKLTISLPYEGR